MLNYAQAQKNLVTNGGFEDELYGWNDNGAAKQTPWDVKSGKNSCAIITTDATQWVGIYQVIKIPKKAHDIAFSAWLKTEHVTKGADEWNGAVFIIVFLDGQDKEMPHGINIANLTGDQQWSFAQKKINIPDNAFSFKILFAMGYAAGTMLIDDVGAVVVD